MALMFGVPAKARMADTVTGHSTDQVSSTYKLTKNCTGIKISAYIVKISAGTSVPYLPI